MGDPRYWPAPDDLSGNLEHVQEECAELTLAIAKFLRYGSNATDPYTQVHYDNRADVLREMNDAEAAIARCRNTMNRWHSMGHKA